MRKITIAVAAAVLLLFSVGGTKYVPFPKDNNDYLDEAQQMTIAAAKSLRPAYRSCKVEELNALAHTLNTRSNCSALVFSSAGGIHLANWEVSAEEEEPLESLPIKDIATRAAKKYSIISGAFDDSGKFHCAKGTSCYVPPKAAQPDPRLNSWNTDHLTYLGTVVQSGMRIFETDFIQGDYNECEYDVKINGAEAWWNGDEYTRGWNRPYPSDRRGVWVFTAARLLDTCPEIGAGQEVTIVADKRTKPTERLQAAGISLNITAEGQMSKRDMYFLCKRNHHWCNP